LRNYSTLIAIRKGNDVRITNIKYSKTTSTITNRLKALAEEMGYNVSYVSKFEEGGETFAGGGGVKGIKNRAEKLLEESISYRWVNTDMGSGWSFELESPSNRSVFNVIEQHTYLDEFSPEDAGFEDWDDLSEEDKDYYYQEWKEEFYQGAFERFKEKCMKHLDDFIEYLQRDSDEDFYAGGGEAGEKGKLNATYIPKRNIKTLTTTYGNTIKGKDLLDGAYTTRKDILQDPKMVRTIFEEEEFAEFNNGGGVGKTSNLSSVKRKYLKNENENAHSENVVLLAENFGDSEDLKLAKEILKLHNTEGHLSTENGKIRQELHLKLLKIARKKFGQEGIEFEEGGEAKKRRRRANLQTGRTDRSVDKTRVGKPVGYRFTNSLASKLRKDQYAVPTEKQITKYLGKGIYKENRKNRSDKDKIAKL
jgi:hypothetical protein